MHDTIKNILEHLSDYNTWVTIQMDNCKLCLNNKNVRDTYKYFPTYLSDNYDSYKIQYNELVMSQWFIDALASYIWNYAPRSKGKYPKIVWLEWQLKYETIEEIKEDMKMLFGLSIQDNSLDEYLEAFYVSNLLHKNA